jgi:hypothetical protein
MIAGHAPLYHPAREKKFWAECSCGWKHERADRKYAIRSIWLEHVALTLEAELKQLRNWNARKTITRGA